MNQPAKSPATTDTKAPPALPPEAAAPPVPFRPLPMPRLKLIRSSESDFANSWGMVTTSGTPWAHVLRPDYLSLHANKLRVGDTIEVHTDDQVYFGRLLVRSVDGTG